MPSVDQCKYLGSRIMVNTKNCDIDMRKALINLYYSLVFPYLIYCNEVWGNASAVHLEPIIKIHYQNSPSEPIFQSLNILNFSKLVIQRVSLLMFKISKCDVPKPLHSLFRINNSYHNYQTRRSESIHVPIGRPKLYIKRLVILVLTYGIRYPIIFQQMCLILPLNIL